MAIDLSALFGQQPDYSQFISPAETQRMQSGANQSALLNAAIALLGSSGQTRQPISTGQALGGALGAGLEGYNQSFDRNLKQIVTGMQLGEYQRKQQAQDLARKAFTQTPVPIPMATGAESQLGMLSLPQFGGDMPGVRGEPLALTETARTLEQNLPTKTTVDMNKLIQALSMSGTEGMIEAAKLAAPKEGMKLSDVAGGVKEAVQVLGIKDQQGRLKTPDLFTAEDQSRVNKYINEKTAQQAPKINVSDPTAVAKAQSENVKDFNTQVKDFREVSRRYNAMVEAHKDKANPATDSTLIYGLAKIYDPTGAVQQGDIATIKGKRSIPESVVGLAEKLSRGGTLTPQERDNVISTAYSMINSYSKSVQSDVDTYRSFSKSFGADPNQIKNPFENLAKPEYIFVTIGGKQQKATKATDGNYYIQRGDQYYKVSD